MLPPSVLLPYQSAVLHSWITRPLTVVEKSRQVGITWSLGAGGVARAGLATEHGGRDVHYIAYAEALSKEFLDTSATWAQVFNVAMCDPALEIAEEDFTSLRAVLPSGNDIWAHTGNPRALRGRTGHLIIDEAAFHDDLEKTLAAAMALMMWGGHVLVLSTHLGADNPFAKFVEDCRAGKRGQVGRDVNVIRITFDEAVRQGLFKRICAKTGKPWSPEAEEEFTASMRAFYGAAASQELDAIPAAGSLMYLDKGTIEQNMRLATPVVRLALQPDHISQPEGWRDQFITDWLERAVLPVLATFPTHRASYLGQDFGRHRDLTVITAGHDTDDGRLAAPLIVELSNVPYREQEFILKWIIDRLPRFAGAQLDARGNGEVLGEKLTERYGATLINAHKATEATYLETMPALKAALQDRGLDLPRDAEISDDLRCVALIRGVPKIDDAKAAKAKGRHGDSAISIMNFVAVAKRGQGAPLEVAATPRGGRAGAMRAMADTNPFGRAMRSARADFFNVKPGFGGLTR